MRRDPLWRAVRLLDVPWRRVAAAVALGTLALGCAVGLTAASAWLIARASQMPPVLQLSVAVVAVRAFGIGRGVFRYTERVASHDVALRGMAALRTNLYDAMAAGRPAALVRLRRGDLLARVGADVDAVGDLVVRALIPIGVAVTISLGSVILVGAFLPGAGAALAGCLVLAGVVAPWLSARSARAVEERGSAARAAMSAAVVEALESAGPLLVSGRMDPTMSALRAADRELAAVNDAGGRMSGLSVALTNAAIGLAVLASLWLGIPAVTAGALAPVELSVIVLTPLAAFEAAGALPAAAVQLRRSRIAARRVLELVDDACIEAVGSRLPAAPAPSTAQDHTLRLSDAACGWSGRAVIAGVDLVAEPGRAVAVVGPSGVGKTTLLMTAAGILAPVEGSATVGGTATADLDSRALAARAVFVAEDGHIFETSVLENLRVARGDADAAAAERVLADVGLLAWVRALPDGLDTRLGPDATTISGGERRRLLVARALLAPAPLLLVDEPAEHLDPAGADALVSRLIARTRQANHGVVIATHRLSALAEVDEILLLGRAQGATGPATVLARGTHRELLDVPDYCWALRQEAVPVP